MLTKTQTEKKTCVSGKFKRMNYFNGMLLTEQDFEDEQTYIREKLQLHNRIHGSGVVWGMSLKKGCITVGDGEITRIFIEAGLAIDCAGDEIVVCEDFPVPLHEKIKQLRKFGLLRKVGECDVQEYEGPPLYIGIRYCECESQPAEQYTSECPDDPLHPKFARVREGFAVEILTADEYAGCVEAANRKNGKNGDCNCPGVAPCSEDERTIFLGYVEGYDTSEVDYPDHAEATIHHLDTRFMNNWEQLKQDMLREVLGDRASWLDITPLIGKPVSYFERIQDEMRLRKGNIFRPAAMSDQELRIILEMSRDALPWAWSNPDDIEQSDTIDVVTDQSGKCILFPFIRERSSYQELKKKDRSSLNAEFLGNSNTMEVHNLSAETPRCQIDEILEAGHDVAFSPDTLEQAHEQGFDNCAYCIGGSTR